MADVHPREWTHEVPCAGGQSLEGDIAVGDVGCRRVDDARRAWVVLEKIDEGK
jgi:hypothetical protein